VPDIDPLYLDTPAAVDDFLATIAGAPALAVDTEGASFHRFVDRVYLLQLSTAEHTAVLDPLRIGEPARLGAMLADASVEVVLHDADYDLRLLRKDYGWQVSGLFDTRVAAQLLGIRSFGLAALLDRYFGIRLDKKHQRADWSRRPLPADMLAYAAHDTHWLLDLRERMRRELEKAGRWHWAQEEFRQAEGTAWEPEDRSQAFLRLKGARDLSRRELARLRAAVAWRNAIAESIDRATFRVAPNELLLEVARKGPQSAAEVSRLKGFPRSMSADRVAPLLAELERADALPEAELPRFPKARRWERDPDFDDIVAHLKGVRDREAQRLDLDPGVLCSRDRMEAVARARPVDLDAMRAVAPLRDWQVEVLGEDFLEAMRPFAKAPAGEDSPYRD
jgi:ribonuclease D